MLLMKKCLESIFLSDKTLKKYFDQNYIFFSSFFRKSVQVFESKRWIFKQIIFFISNYTFITIQNKNRKKMGWRGERYPAWRDWNRKTATTVGLEFYLRSPIFSPIGRKKQLGMGGGVTDLIFLIQRPKKYYQIFWYRGVPYNHIPNGIY